MARWGAGLIVALVALAFANSFTVPFLFDDRGAILGNRSLDSFATALHPPIEYGLTVAGRPLLNLSLALNRQLGGDAVWGYHLVNVAIHAGAALALCGLLRRLLRLPLCRPRIAPLGGPDAVALAVAALWAVHPLQTESVTYIVQRAESLAGLAVWFSLYAFLRAADGARGGWIAAVAACWLGVATKEVVAITPVLALLLDRTFLAGSFRAALRVRWKLHALLFMSWAILAWLVFGAGGRGGSVGYATGVTWWQYALTQADAIVRYLGLAVWPHPQVFDYGTALAPDAGAVWWQLVLVLSLLGATAWALVRRPWWGFVGAVFFCALGPTSSVIPVVTQTIAEHRMYLALAPLALLGVLGLRRLLPGLLGALAVGVVIAVALVATLARNRDYQSERGLWEQTAQRRPGNARAHFNVGVILARAGETVAALDRYRTAVALQPDYVEAHNNLGSTLLALGRNAEALAHYDAALRAAPDSTTTLNNQAVALLKENRVGEALAPLDAALRIDSDYAEAHFNRGNVFGRLGRLDEAVTSFETALRLAPSHRGAAVNLSTALAGLGRLDEARARLETARRAAPDAPELSVALGNLALQRGEPDAAIAHFEAALRASPDHTEASYTLASVLLQTGRRADAIRRLETLLKAHPEFGAARELLKRAKGG